MVWVAGIEKVVRAGGNRPCGGVGSGNGSRGREYGGIRVG